jgi:hypothetical protein
MDSIGAGDLVKVATGGPEVDGIVFDTPSASRVVVAIVDQARGPVLRTVSRDALSERTQAGPGDKALHLLIRRTPPPVHGAARDGAGVGGGRSGHARAATHRTVGR